MLFTLPTSLLSPLPYIHIFLCLLSSSSLTHPLSFSLDHAVRTVQPPLICSLAEVLLITIHAPLLLSAGSTAEQKSYKYTHVHEHPPISQTHCSSLLFLFFASISYPLQNISLLYLLLFPIDIASRYSSLYWLPLLKDVCLHVQFLFWNCFGTDCEKESELEELDTKREVAAVLSSQFSSREPWIYVFMLTCWVQVVFNERERVIERGRGLMKQEMSMPSCRWKWRIHMLWSRRGSLLMWKTADRLTATWINPYICAYKCFSTTPPSLSHLLLSSFFPLFVLYVHLFIS